MSVVETTYFDKKGNLCVKWTRVADSHRKRPMKRTPEGAAREAAAKAAQGLKSYKTLEPPVRLEHPKVKELRDILYADKKFKFTLKGKWAKAALDKKWWITDFIQLSLADVQELSPELVPKWMRERRHYVRALAFYWVFGGSTDIEEHSRTSPWNKFALVQKQMAHAVEVVMPVIGEPMCRLESLCVSRWRREGMIHELVYVANEGSSTLHRV